MSTVDNRIVNMQFNNREFESRIQTSISSLDKLKKGLKLEESAKSLENLEKAGKKFSIAGIADGVDKIANKFSVLGIMGVTALQNITNTAVNAGKRIVSALTIDPIKMGFSEYETQINAVQTILANTSSKGTTLTDVNAALDELNAYADKTIYNFTEMTRNIGTFTAAGVELDTSVQAIKGIANLAAVSGSTSQQASTAMYQLSQALASGTVKLMDWNSVVNAGMGGQVFQDALKETARVHGVNIDQMIKNEGSFRETLKDGWLTSEILTETLSKFTGDLNEEQLKTMGYTQEQIKSIMEMGQMANDAATKVKTFTQLFDTLKEAAQSGWTQSWEIIVGDFEEAKELLTEVSDVFGGIIGASAEARNEMLKGWKDLGGRASLIEAVRNAFHGILDVIKPVKEAFNEIFPPITGQQLFNLTEGLKKLTEQFKIGETTAANIKSTFKGVFALLDIGVMAIKALAQGAFDLVGAILPVGDGLLGITGGIGEFIVGLRNSLKEGNAFGKMVTGITDILKVAIGWIEGLVNAINESFKGFANVDTSGLDALSGKVQARFAPFEAIGNALKWIFSGIVGVVEKAIPIAAKFASMVGEAFGGLTDTITNAINTGDFSQVLDIFNTGLLGGLIYGIKKFVDSLSGITENAGGFLEAITGILDGVKGSLEAYQSSLKAKTLITIAGAIAILAAALTVLSLIDSGKLGGALAAVTAMFVELFAAMAIFEKIMAGKGFKGMAKVSLGMIALSTAVLILSAAMKNIADLNLAQLFKGLGGIAGMAAILVVSANALSKSHGKLIKGSTGLIAFAAALLILSSAVEKIGNIDSDKLVKGLLGLGALMAELAIFTKVISGSKGILTTSIGMVALGAAMVILGSAIEKMGNLSMEQIGKGLLTMAGALTAITVAMNFMPATMIISSVGMIAIAGALVILAGALKIMGGMSWEEIGKGLTVLAGSLTIIAIAVTAMLAALPGAAALLVVSASLVVLAGALKIMASMSWGEIAKALVTLAAAFAVIGVAGMLLAPLTPVLLGLGAAIALLGVGITAIGAGVLLFSTALAALAVSGTAGAAALVVIVTSIIGLIPMLITKIGEGIIAFAKVITDGAPAILTAVKTLLLGLIDTIVEVTPALVEGLLTLLVKLLQSIADKTPDFVQAGFDILIGFLKGVRDNIGEVVEVAIDIVIEFLDALGKKWKDVVDAGFDLIIDFINGLADSVEKNMPRLVDAIWNLGEAIVNGLKDSIVLLKDKAWTAIKDMAQGLIDSFKEKLGIVKDGCTVFKNMAGDIINGLINGIKEGLGNLVQSGKDLGSSVLTGIKDFLGIKSPSRVMRDEVGHYIVEGITEGIKKNDSAEEAAKKKAQNIVSAFKTEFDKLDLKSTTQNLEKELWDAFNGPVATDADILRKEIETVNNKSAIAWQKMDLAQGEYQTTLKEFGESSDKTQEAYNKLLQRRIEFVTLQNELIDLNNQLEAVLNPAPVDTSEDSKELADLELELWQKVNDKTATEADKAIANIATLNQKITTQIGAVQFAQEEYQNVMKEFGESSEEANIMYKEYLQEQIELADMMNELADLKESAKEIEGYRKNDTLKDLVEGVEGATEEALQAVQTVYNESADETFGSLLPKFNEWGSTYAEALGTGIAKNTSKVEAVVKTLVEDCVDAMRDKEKEWKRAGKYLVNGFIEGIEDNIDRAARAAAKMAKEALEAAEAELDINSPSREFARLGRYVDEGFAQGILKFASVAKGATSQLGEETIQGFTDIIKHISELATDDMDMTPVIRPVIDLTDVENSEKKLNSIFDTNRAFNATASINSASRISSRMNNNQPDSTQINNQPTQGASFSFVQNNYSPTALSRLDIYRQTKNQFSTLKGLVSGT